MTLHAVHREIAVHLLSNQKTRVNALAFDLANPVEAHADAIVRFLRACAGA